jgi:hypothetical protein
MEVIGVLVVALTVNMETDLQKVTYQAGLIEKAFDAGVDHEYAKHFGVLHNRWPAKKEWLKENGVTEGKEKV